MSLAKSLSEEQISKIQSWADRGDGLSEIQKNLAEDMEIKVTYLELRFLLDDLGVKLKEDEPEPESSAADTDDGDVDGAEPEEAGGEKIPTGDEVVVSLSALQRPGAILSGTATFSGGEVADWWLDQLGQLGMNPKNESFRPNKAQTMAFQKELQRVVREQGGI